MKTIGYKFNFFRDLIAELTSFFRYYFNLILTPIIKIKFCKLKPNDLQRDHPQAWKLTGNFLVIFQESEKLFDNSLKNYFDI